VVQKLVQRIVVHLDKTHVEDDDPRRDRRCELLKEMCVEEKDMVE